MPAPRPDGPNRTLGDLNDFANTVGLTTTGCDPDTAARYLGEALGADLVAVHQDGAIRDVVLWPDSTLSADELLRRVGESAGGVQRSFADSRAVMEVCLPPLGHRLILSRPEIEFSPDEREFAAAVAMSIGNSSAVRSSARLNTDLQDELERVGSRLERMCDDLEAAQGLLDRLSRIQELISLRPPIDVLLESVAASASYLIEADNIDLHLLDSAVGVAPRIWADLTTASAARAAMAEDRLVVVRSAESAVAHGDSSPAIHAVSAPIRVAGRVVGCLVAARASVSRPFSPPDQESMIALALHASIALQDSRAVDAMRMSLERERHRSEHDFLTGLPNRGTVLERLERRLEQSHNGPVTVLFVDIDDFKMTNDELGHRSGDEALVVVADRIRSTVRRQDLVGRIAADEFVVVCSDMSEIGAVELARRVQDQVSLPMRLSGRDHLMTVSVGVAGAEPSDTAEKAIANADLAAGRAKQSGRESVEVFDLELRRMQRARATAQMELRAAIAENQLVVYLQPVVSLPERRVVSFEALARWRHPRRGIVLPDDFIPLAEESDLIRELDRQIIDLALGLMVTQSHPIPIAVNLSARTLADPGLAGWFRSRFEHHGVDPRLVVVELTETVLLRPTRSTTTQLDQLRALGVRVVLDDFGTGYSSLSTLQNFDVDGVKIDRSFVSILGEDARADAIVSAVFHMAAAMRLGVVAEGVETDDQAVRLVRLRDESGNVTLSGQGFLFGRPAAGAEVMAGFLPISEADVSTAWMLHK